MAEKTSYIRVRTSPQDKAHLIEAARIGGFTDRGGKPKLSSYIRWILEHGAKPIDRDTYSDLKQLNHNLIKTGTLLNQMLFQINKERKILNSEGGHNENNKHFLSRLNEVEALILDLQNIEKDIQKAQRNIVVRESV